MFTRKTASDTRRRTFQLKIAAANFQRAAKFLINQFDVPIKSGNLYHINTIEENRTLVPCHTTHLYSLIIKLPQKHLGAGLVVGCSSCINIQRFITGIRTGTNVFTPSIVTSACSSVSPSRIDYLIHIFPLLCDGKWSKATTFTNVTKYQSSNKKDLYKVEMYDFAQILVRIMIENVRAHILMEVNNGADVEMDILL